MKKVAVTGGHGTLGTEIVVRLLMRGCHAVILDRKEGKGCFQGNNNVTEIIVDLNDLAQVEQSLTECDAVIHMGAIPGPIENLNEIVFANNVTSTYNVLEAAARLGIDKVVLASSESAYGFPYAHKPLAPIYVPVDEAHPLIPEDCYGLSKAANELTGESFHRRTGMQVVSMRLSSVLNQEGYELFQSMLDHPKEFRRVLWSYVDVRDAAEACILAVEREELGCVSLNIAADDTFQTRLSRDLLREFFPEVMDIRVAYAGFEPFYSNAKAKALLGWQPVHRWRDVMETNNGR